MIFLSPFLLSISSNLNTLKVSLSYGLKKIHFTKSITILLAIITSIGTFLSLYLGKLILQLFNPQLGNIFGAILLSFIGVYFIVEYIRLENKHSGYDTSYYFESSFKYKTLIENPDNINYDKSNLLDIRDSLNISLAFVLNNLSIYFAASITGFSISITIFFNFIITLFSVYIGNFNLNTSISKWFIKYSNLISGIILIILGICEAFI